MSIRNIKSKVISSADISTNYSLTRSDIFYFIEFVNYENELYNADSKLTSKPNVIFYTENSVDKVILDYSSANTTDKTYLKTFFIGMNQSNGISLSNCSYLEESKDIQADISSNLTFSEYKNNYIFATVNSTVDKSIETDVYTADYFISTPQIKSGLPLEENEVTKRNALVCLNVGGKSLSSLGLYPGDVIEVINAKSSNMGTRFEILDTLMLNDKELIVIKQNAVSEKLIGSPSVVQLYQPRIGSPSVVLDLNDKVFGNCVKDITTIKNSTKYQCQLRSGIFSR